MSDQKLKPCDCLKLSDNASTARYCEKVKLTRGENLWGARWHCYSQVSARGSTIWASMPPFLVVYSHDITQQQRELSRLKGHKWWMPTEQRSAFHVSSERKHGWRKKTAPERNSGQKKLSSTALFGLTSATIRTTMSSEHQNTKKMRIWNISTLIDPLTRHIPGADGLINMMSHPAPHCMDSTDESSANRVNDGDNICFMRVIVT